LSIAPVLTSMAARRFANDAFVVIGRGTHIARVLPMTADGRATSGSRIRFSNDDRKEALRGDARRLV
jgi:hypothetical protein